jgi:hypothetical protein
LKLRIDIDEIDPWGIRKGRRGASGGSARLPLVIRELGPSFDLNHHKFAIQLQN